MISKINKLRPYTNNFNLLFVEDEDIAREEISEFLKYLFNNVFTASNGEEAYEKFSKNKIDIIITDIKMPKMDGKELVKKIRQEDRCLPILILSQHNEANIILECINLRIDRYVLKPVVYEELLQAIQESLDINITKILETPDLAPLYRTQNSE